jgi:glutamate/tyrosine decarboxylase-like PLP-dependent enzyme
VDAAWGGYLATLFRHPDGSLRSRGEVAAGFEAFPSQPVHAAFAALERCDSVTVDPHKLGYLPYGAGAFVCRDHRAMALLAEGADYVFHSEAPADYLHHYRSLGQYTLEGSKPGAAAAAAYVTHKVLPLDHAGLGRLQAHSIRAAERFAEAAKRFSASLADTCRVEIPFQPDSNLVCLALNPAGNRDLAVASAFVRQLHRGLKCDQSQPLQVREYFGSVTTLRLDGLHRHDLARIVERLDLDPPVGDGDACLVILRHTLMNPYLVDHENGISYIDGYFNYLSKRVRALVLADAG